jgi:hypothetical protein
MRRSVDHRGHLRLVSSHDSAVQREAVPAALWEGALWAVVGTLLGTLVWLCVLWRL